MTILYNIIFLFTSCVIYASSTVIVKAPCPDIKPVANFNFTAYKGIWYEIAKYPDDWEKKGDCGVMEYDINSPNAFNLSNVVDKQRSAVTGTITVEGGVLYHKSDDFKRAEGTNVIPVNIIAVDYDRYAVIYECMYRDDINARHDYCWIMSRDRKTNPELTKKAIDFVKSTGVIDTSKLAWNHLTDEACLM